MKRHITFLLSLLAFTFISAPASFAATKEVNYGLGWASISEGYTSIAQITQAQVASDLGVTESEIADHVYFRWSLRNSNGEVINMTSSSAFLSGFSAGEIGSQWNPGKPFFDTPNANVEYSDGMVRWYVIGGSMKCDMSGYSPLFAIKSTSGLDTDCYLCCEVAYSQFNTANCTATNAWGPVMKSSDEDNAGFFSLVYKIYLGNIPSSFTNLGSQTEHNATVTLGAGAPKTASWDSSVYTKLFNGDVQYARVTLTTSKGAPVANPSSVATIGGMASWTQADQASLGWYKTGASIANLPTSITSTESLSRYQLHVYVSTNGSDLVDGQEPVIDHEYIISFKRTPVVKEYTLGLSEIGKYYQIDLANLTVAQLAEFMDVSTDDLNSNFYMRIGLFDQNGVQKPFNGSPYVLSKSNDLYNQNSYPYSTAPNSWTDTYYSDGYARWYTGKYDTNDTQTLADHFNPYIKCMSSGSGTLELTDYFVIDFTDEFSASNATFMDAAEENKFALQYKVYFTGAPDPFPNIGHIVSTQSATINVPAATANTISEGLYTSLDLDGNTPQYARIMITDAAGNEIANPDTAITFDGIAGWTLADTPVYGWYRSITSLSELPSSFTTVAGNKLSNYKIVVYISTLGSTLSGAGQEPEIDYQYTISFKTARNATKEFEYSLGLSDVPESGGRIDLGLTVDGVAETIGCTIADLASSAYLRIKVLDGNGTEVRPHNWPVDNYFYLGGVSGKIYPFGKSANQSDFTPYQEPDPYHRWYTGKTLDFDLGELLRPYVNYATEPFSVDYTFIVEIATDFDPASISEFKSNDENVENFFNVRYTLHLGSAFPNVDENSIAKTSQTITLEPSSLNSVAVDYAGLDFHGNTPQYARIRVLDYIGNPVDDPSTVITFPGIGDWTLVDPAHYGWYKAVSSIAELPATFSTVDGNAINRYKILVNFSTEGSAPNAAGKEPRISFRHTVSFVRPVKEFETIYLDHCETPDAPVALFNGEITPDEVLAELGITDGAYVRFSLRDAEGNLVGFNTAGVTLSTSSTASQCAPFGVTSAAFNDSPSDGYLSWYVRKTANTLAEVLAPYINFSDPDVLGYSLVMEIATAVDPDLIENYAIDAATANATNFFDLKYTFHIGDAFPNYAKAEPASARLNIDAETLEAPLAEVYSKLPATTRYVRFVLTDSEGNVVANPSAIVDLPYSEWTAAPKTKFGYWTNIASTAELPEKIKALGAAQLNNYQLVIYAADAAYSPAAAAPSRAATPVTQEPQVTTALTVTFKKPAAGNEVHFYVGLPSYTILPSNNEVHYFKLRLGDFDVSFEDLAAAMGTTADELENGLYMRVGMYKNGEDGNINFNNNPFRITGYDPSDGNFTWSQYPFSANQYTETSYSDGFGRWYTEKYVPLSATIDNILVPYFCFKSTSYSGIELTTDHYLVFEYTNEYSADPSELLDANESNDGFFKVRYYVHFCEEPNTLPNIESIEGKYAYEVALDPSDKINAEWEYSNIYAKSGDIAPQYARIAVIGPDGEPLKNPDTYIKFPGFDMSNWSLCDITANGWNNTTDFNSLSTLPLQARAIGSLDLTQMSVVVYVSVRDNDLDASGQEPQIDYNYTISFAPKFKDTTYDGGEVSTTMQIYNFKSGDNYVVSILPGSIFYKARIEYNDPLLKSLIEDDEFDGPLPEIPAEGPLYVRYSVRKNGVEVPSLRSGFEFDENPVLNGAIVDKDDRYIYFYKADGALPTIEQLINFRLNNSVLYPLSDCELVIDFSTNPGTLGADDKLVSEPELTGRVVIKFEEHPYVVTNLDGVYEYVGEAHLLPDDNRLETMMMKYEHQFIEYFLGKGVEPKYVRVWIEHRNPDNSFSPIDDYTDFTINQTGSLTAHTTENPEDGYFFYGDYVWYYNQWAVTPETTFQNFPFTVSAGFTDDIFNYRIVYILSDEEFDAENSYSEPTPKMKYTYFIREIIPSNVAINEVPTECQSEALGYKFIHFMGIGNDTNDETDYEIISLGDPGEPDIHRRALQVRQKVHEYTYYRYIEPGETYNLKLPLQFVDGTGDELEPQSYFRWYDYNTDFASSLIRPYSSTASLADPRGYEPSAENQLMNYFWDYDNETGAIRSRGLFGLNVGSHIERPVDSWPQITGGVTRKIRGTNATSKNVASVTFTAPNDPSWEGTTIACDVSKYVDGQDNNSYYLYREPTLSIRYKYEIRPAKACADGIKAAIEGNSNELFEDYGSFFFGTNAADNGESSYVYLRTRNQDVSTYFFYDYTVDTVDDGAGNPIRQGTFSNEIYKCDHVKWRVYDSSGKYVGRIPEGYVHENGRFCEISGSIIEEILFYSKDLVDGTNDPAEWGDNGNLGDPIHLSFIPGSYVYVYGYAEDAEKKHATPLVHYTVRFLYDSAPKTFQQIAESYPTRSLEYLKEKYNLVGEIDFDHAMGANYLEPRSFYDNLNPYPIGVEMVTKWDAGSYGYCYPYLYSHIAGFAGDYAGLGPLHGDYQLRKSMNYVEDSSGGVGGELDQYGFKDLRWYTTEPALMGRTWEISGGELYGYYLYIDASDEARQIAEVPFHGDMCVGSTLIFTACIANLTSQTISPQVVFRVYGVKYDNDGNIVDKHLVHTYTSGDFDSVGATQKGVWYQVYGKMYFRPDSNVDQYSDFVVSLENFCSGTDGADYAIDNIRIYISNAKTEVLQTKASCEDDAEFLFTMEHQNLLNNLPVDLHSEMILAREDYNHRVVDAAGNDVLDAEGHYTYNSPYPLSTIDRSNPETWPIFYWRICDKATNAPIEAPAGLTDAETAAYYDSFYHNNGLPYGASRIPPYLYFDNENQYSDSDFENIPELFVYQQYPDGSYRPGFTKDADGYLHYVFFSGALPLRQSKEYFVSVAYLDAEPDPSTHIIDENDWGTLTNTCSIYSDPFSPAGQKFQLLDATNEKAFDSAIVECGDDGVEKTFSGQLMLPDEYGAYHAYTPNPALLFHWEIYEVDAAGNEVPRYITGADGDLGLNSATSNPKYQYDTYVEGEKTITYESHVTFEFGLGKTYIVKANVYPDTGEITVDGNSYIVCDSEMEITISSKIGGPDLELGYSDVIYPEGFTRSFRMGLPQYKDMVANKKPLILPVQYFKDRDGETEGMLLLGSDSSVGATPGVRKYGNLTLVNTNDPSIPVANYGQIVGRVSGEGFDANGTPGFINSEIKSDYTTDNYVRVEWWYDDATVGALGQHMTEIGSDPMGNIGAGAATCPYVFHEGYEYTFAFGFYDAATPAALAARGDVAACTGTCTFVLKIVPEYTSWTGAQEFNTNWINDGNWTRSSREILYKIADGKVPNALATNSDSYVDYPDIDCSSIGAEVKLEHLADYVPMGFTKVTILPGVQAPYLSSMETNGHGILRYPVNNDLSNATPNIEYEILVKWYGWGFDCYQYDCEKFTGNRCDQIYFKPDAELRFQHYLSYNRAWVEKEFVPGEWTMFASPLESVYAGDMYTPISGRQTTEAFRPITFNTKVNGNTTYSRNEYPFYQRSWDRDESWVVLPKGDDRGEAYDAFIKYTHWNDDLENGAIVVNWSHTFNEVSWKYPGGQGVEIRPGKPSASPTPLALLRLPKEDTSYEYFYYDDSTDHNTNIEHLNKPLNRSEQGRMLTDKSNEFTSAVTFSVPVVENFQINPFILTGNPFLASFDMKQFFVNMRNFNSDFENKYWYVHDGIMHYAFYDSGTGTWDFTGDEHGGVIEPMQAFFVKLRDTSSLVEGNYIEFNFMPEWTVDVMNLSRASSASSSSYSSRSITVKAEGGSCSQIRLREGSDYAFVENEDLEALFDTNLTVEAPMVYTIAGDMAALVNTLPDFDVIPLGVVGPEGTQALLTFEGVDSELYLHDAATGLSTPLYGLEEGNATATVDCNSHGRYFLTPTPIPLDGDASGESGEQLIFIYATGQGQVTVSAPTANTIENVAVYDLTGALIRRVTNFEGNTLTLTLPSDCYVITASTSVSTSTAKLLVR